MARLLTTGWETGGHETNGGVYKDVPMNINVQSTIKRTGSYALQINVGAGGHAYAVQILPDVAEIYFRFAFFHDDAGSGDGTNTVLISFHEGGSEHLSIGMTSDTLLLRLVVRGATVDTGACVMTQNTWFMIEGHVKIANSGGAVEVKVNSVTDMSYSGDTCSTSNEFATSVRLGVQDGIYLRSYTFDDFALNDTTGSHQNSWIGLGGVFLLKPTADGAQTDWTPSAGTTNWDKVDETPRNTTDWVQGANSGELDLYEVEDCPEYINTIDLVEVLYQAAVVTSGSNTVIDVVRQGTVNYSGGSAVVVSIEPSYAFYRGSTYYVQTNGSGAWGTAEVNALHAGMMIA